MQRQILDQLKELQQRLGISVILVTHDISAVAYTCDKMVVMYAARVTESGDTATVLAAPFHPYTMGLYNAFPDLAAAGGVLTPIQGAPPSLIEPPPGCRFAERCPFCQSACRTVVPALHEVSDGHSTACHRVSEVDELRTRAARTETWEASA